MNLETGRQDVQRQQQEQITETWKAHLLAFAKEIKASVSDEEKMSLDETGGPTGLVEDVISMTVQQPERFKTQLADLVKTLKIATGKTLFCKDLNGGLVVSADGEIGIAHGESFRMMPAPLGQEGITMKRDEVQYELLTGPRKGEMVSSKEIPLWASGIPDKGVAEA